MRTAHIVVILVFCGIGIVTSTNIGFKREDVCRAVRRCTQILDKGKNCPALSIPRKAFLTPVGPKGYKLTKLRRGLWLYEDVGYLSLFLKVGRRLAVLDLPDSINSNKPDGSGTRLTDAAEELIGAKNLKRIDIVYSHAHFDHIGAATRFYNFFKKKNPRTEIFTWGTEEGRRLVERSLTKRAVPPNVIVSKTGRTLRLSKELEVRMIPTSVHTINDLMMYIPRYKDQAAIVMLVDAAYPSWSPLFYLGFTTSVGDYITSKKDLLKLDFDIFVGGHNKAGTRKDVEMHLKFSEDLVEAARQAVASVTGEDLLKAGAGRFEDPKTVEFGNTWFTFDVLNRLRINRCYRIMLPKWGCKLAGLDFTLRSHCDTAIKYIVTEY